jgi:thioredoxin-like negative regulator of GroEL
MNQYHISILALVLTVTIAVPTKLTTSNYEAYVSQNPVVILHLYQGQCGHCEMLHQELDRLKELLNDKNYGIAEVSCTESSPVCSKFTSQRMPGVIVVARGAPVEYHGDLTAEDFNDWIL